MSEYTHNDIKQELLDKAVREGWPDWKTEMYLYLYAPTKQKKETTMETSTDKFGQLYLAAYWVVRAVLEGAELTLAPFHPLWSDINELIEVCDRMETELDIANPTDAFKHEE